MTDFDDRVSTSSPVVAHETPETSGKLRALAGEKAKQLVRTLEHLDTAIDGSAALCFWGIEHESDHGRGEKIECDT